MATGRRILQGECEPEINIMGSTSKSVLERPWLSTQSISDAQNFRVYSYVLRQVAVFVLDFYVGAMR